MVIITTILILTVLDRHHHRRHTTQADTTQAGIIQEDTIQADIINDSASGTRVEYSLCHLLLFVSNLCQAICIPRPYGIFQGGAL